MSKQRSLQVAAGIGLIGSLAACTTFTNGPHVVGSNSKYEVKPGLYTSSKPVSTSPDFNTSCLWLRDLALNGKPSTPKGNDQEFGGRSFIQILPTDTTFFTQGCGLWTPPKATSYNPDRATAKTGAYRIPTDLLPGTYTAPGGALCSWTRVSSFKGDQASIIATSLPSNPKAAYHGVKNPRVTIAKTDVGFLTDICGGWRRVGP